MSRRKILLLVWALSIIITGVIICSVTGDARLGWAASLSLIAISLGVPLMRAFTEFSK
jgi:hypothetical protein